MAFSPIFQRPFSATFDRRAAAAAAPAWWLAGGAPTPLAVYEPKGKIDIATSYVNLITPGTYNAAPGTAPTFNAATGWTGGSNAYLTTGITPASGWAALVRFTNANSGGNLLGGRNASRMELRPVEGTGIQYGNGGIVNVAPTLSAGVVAVAEQTGYRDGVVDTSGIPAWTGVARELWILATNFGFAQGYFTGSIQAIAIWNTATNHATWMPAVSAAVALI